MKLNLELRARTQKLGRIRTCPILVKSRRRLIDSLPSIRNQWRQVVFKLPLSRIYALARTQKFIDGGCEDPDAIPTTRLEGCMAALIAERARLEWRLSEIGKTRVVVDGGKRRWKLEEKKDASRKIVGERQKGRKV